VEHPTSTMDRFARPAVDALYPDDKNCIASLRSNRLKRMHVDKSAVRFARAYDVKQMCTQRHAALNAFCDMPSAPVALTVCSVCRVGGLGYRTERARPTGTTRQQERPVGRGPRERLHEHFCSVPSMQVARWQKVQLAGVLYARLHAIIANEVRSS